MTTCVELLKLHHGFIAICRDLDICCHVALLPSTVTSMFGKAAAPKPADQGL